MSPDEDDIRDRLRIAYHEAAHAVVGMRFGWETERVEISPTGGGVHRHIPTPIESTREYTLMVLAGRFGETIITGERREVSDDFLRFVIRKLRSGEVDSRYQGHDDFFVIRIIMQSEPDGTEEELIESYRAEEAEAEALIADPDIRREIETLAETLFQRGEMGEEAKEVVAEAWEEEGS